MHFGFSQCKQKGFTPVVILIGLLLIGLVSGGVYLKYKSTQHFDQKLYNQNPMVDSAKPTLGIKPVSPDNPEGQSCGKNAGPAGDAECTKGYICYYSNPNDDIGTCIKDKYLVENGTWKTYVSKDYGYTIKYPEDFKIQPIDTEFTDFKNNHKVKLHEDIFLKEVDVKPGEATGLPTLFAFRVGIYELGVDPLSSDTKSDELVTISGQGYKKIYGLGKSTTTVGPIIHNNYQYVFYSQRNEFDPNLFNEFISTFKFN